MKFNKLGFLLAGSILLGGCSNSNDPEEVKQAVLRTSAPEAVSSISILIQDLDGNPLPDIAVTIDDNDTGLLGKLTNRPVVAKGLYARTEDLTTDELGYVTFELEEGTVEGDLTVTINDGSYFPVTQIYSIDSEVQSDTMTLTAKPEAGETESVVVVTDSGEEEEVITIVAEQAFEEETVEVVDDEGVSVSVQGQVSRIESGTEESDEGEKQVVAEVLIPTGVVPTTVNNVEAQGAITVTAAIYQNDSESSIDAFPGGLEVGDNVVNVGDAPELITDDSSATNDDAAFVSAGFISLEVTDEAGNDITEFSGSTGVDIDGDGVVEDGLLVTSLIPKSTINPATGELLTLGDTVPVWSYNDQTAKWEYDGESKIFESADDDNWRARFAATHLSYWNMDWRYGMCVDYNTVDEGAAIEFLSALTGERDERTLRIKTSRVGNGYYKTRTLNGDGYVRGRLADDNVNITVYDVNSAEFIDVVSINGEPYDGVSGVNFCDLVGSGGNDVVLDESTPYVTTDMTIQVQTSCTDSDLDAFQAPEPMVSTLVYARNEATRQWTRGYTDSTGTVAFTGVNSQSEYRFWVRNRLYPQVGSRYEQAGPLVATDVQPLLVDIEQECVVTTGSVGGS